MKNRCTPYAFLITATLYAIIAAIIFWQFDNITKSAVKKKTIKKVPITISMFQAPTPIVPPKIIPPKPIVKPKPPKPIKKKVIKKKKKIVKKKKIKKRIKKRIPKQVPKLIPEPVEEVIEEVFVPTPVPVVKPVVTQVTPTPPPPPKYSASEIANAEDRYKSELSTAIAILAKDNYPRRAKRRRWEGELTLAFTLHRNGAIINLRIIDKAKRNILNKTAINIIKEKMNMKFKPFYDEIDKEKWEFTQPISFSLKN